MKRIIMKIKKRNKIKDIVVIIIVIIIVKIKARIDNTW